MKISFKHGTRNSDNDAREESALSGSSESVELENSSVAKLIAVLSSASGLGTLMATLIVPLVMYLVRDRPEAAINRGLLERCLAVRTMAVALQADSSSARTAGLKLLVQLRVLPTADSAAIALLSDTAYIPPRWATVSALPDCSTFAVIPDAAAAAPTSRIDGNAAQNGIGSLSDSLRNGRRKPE